MLLESKFFLDRKYGKNRGKGRARAAHHINSQMPEVWTKDSWSMIPYVILTIFLINRIRTQGRKPARILAKTTDSNPKLYFYVCISRFN